MSDIQRRRTRNEKRFGLGSPEGSPCSLLDFFLQSWVWGFFINRYHWGEKMRGGRSGIRVKHQFGMPLLPPEVGGRQGLNIFNKSPFLLGR